MNNKLIGIALSGGGFRASFFHIGVLTQMARQGILKYVDVISTVSGGSIIGAFYYLKLKKKIEDSSDVLSDEDYILLVKEIEEEFYNCVKKNIRKQIYFSWDLNFNFSSKLTKRLNEDFYYPLLLEKNINISALKINPTKSNNKVPKLIINASCLNDGKIMKFIISDKDEELIIDTNIGEAVAASACVPGLFNPVTINTGTRTISLVDGGVLDNLGIESLIEENCTEYMISDGSGYFWNDSNPSSLLHKVINRTQDVFMNNNYLNSLSKISTTNYYHVYLRLNLTSTEQFLPSFYKFDFEQTESTINNNINNEVQHLLSEIRTDLDCFSEIEARSLMLSGFLLSNELIQKSSLSKRVTCFDHYEHEFSFMSLKEDIKNPNDNYLRKLYIGGFRFFKISLLLFTYIFKFIRLFILLTQEFIEMIKYVSSINFKAKRNSYFILFVSFFCEC
ncbi:patatin-like phospholipase family protein [Brevibacillus sp. SYSU BS000544]|uniref:patatin-like phospholipase family protein n=1 Tax=Brevibacillus sp. SYSU BS000544 TaxID=3416443 RepID=UPI003CE4FFEC